MSYVEAIPLLLKLKFQFVFREMLFQNLKYSKYSTGTEFMLRRFIHQQIVMNSYFIPLPGLLCDDWVHPQETYRWPAHKWVLPERMLCWYHFMFFKVTFHVWEKEKSNSYSDLGEGEFCKCSQG